MFRLPKDQELTEDILLELINEHKKEVADRYMKLKAAYESDHDILHQARKANGKPDNRLVVNFPKYIVDTFNGFFIGNPVKVTTDDKKAAEYVEALDQYNDQDNKNSELSKISSIYGKAYEMYYADEDSTPCTAVLTPIGAFMIYDDSIIKRKKGFVRLWTDRDKNEYGSVSNEYGVRYFKLSGALQFTDEDWQPHNFPGVPATEFIENEERQGLFEPVLTLVNAYNKAISEKANDVDYFADAYLKVLGAEMDEDALKFLRDNRIINFSGEGSEKIIVEFLQKPSSDETQENLLERAERLIFQISMVANISDENFGGSSGTALQYRVLNMMNLAGFKKGKFSSGLYSRYKMLFGFPAASVGVSKEAWQGLKFIYPQNLPKNALEEMQIAAGLEGIVSRETQLKVLSVVEDVNAELEKIEEENKPADDTALLGFTDSHEQQEV